MIFSKIKQWGGMAEGEADKSVAECRDLHAKAIVSRN